MADVKKIVKIEVDTETGEVKILNEELEKTGKNLDKAKKGTGGLAGGFKKVGVAIKAAGIGLLVGVLAKLVDLFGQNQKVADGFSTTMTALGIAFNDFFGFISDNIETVRAFFVDLFENPVKYAEQLGNAIKDYVVENVKLVIDGLGLMGNAIGKLFEGDWEGAWEAASDGLLKFGEGAISLAAPGSGILLDVAEAVYDNRDAITEYTKGLFENSQAITDNRKELQLLEVETRRLQLLNQQQAELQRQIRDDETKSFEERIAANERLGQILEDAIVIEQDAVNRRIAILEQEQRLLGYTFERELEIKNLKVELLDIEERITGVRSEQLVNQNSLLREQADAEQARREELHKTFEEQEALAEREVQLAREKAARIAGIEQDAEEARKQLVSDGLSALMALNDAFAADTERAQKRAFRVNKALQIAQASIETYRSATAAYASQLAIPSPDAPIRAAAAAAVATAFGLAQVASIARTKFEGGGSGGGLPSVGRSTGAGSPNQAPQFNTVGASDNNQLAESIANQNSRPMKAYVVASDVTTAQELDRNKVDTASFG